MNNLKEKTVNDLIIEFPYALSIQKVISTISGIYYTVEVNDRNIEIEIISEKKILKEALIDVYNQLYLNLK